MAALTGPRNTPRRGEGLHPASFPIAASVKIWQGSLVVLDGTTKQAKPGVAATGLICVGRAPETYDNTGGAAAAFQIGIDGGVFRWANSAAADAIAQADVGATAYVVDDQTVAKTDGTGARSAAGKIIAVDADGVWVMSKHAD